MQDKHHLLGKNIIYYRIIWLPRMMNTEATASFLPSTFYAFVMKVPALFAASGAACRFKFFAFRYCRRGFQKISAFRAMRSEKSENDDDREQAMPSIIDAFVADFHSNHLVFLFLSRSKGAL